MKIRLVLFFLFAINLTLGAQETVITGLFPGAAHREIRLVLPEDYITWRPHEKEAVTIDRDGKFSFSMHLDGPRLVELRIDHSVSSFFAEPGVNLHLEYAPFDFQAPQRQNVNWLQEEFEYEITATDGQDVLNPNIRTLQELTNGFLESRQNMVRVNHRAALLEFEKVVNERFQQVGHPFFKRYLDDHLAGLHFSLGSIRPEQIIDQHLKPRAIEYDNSNFMYLFSRAFYSYIQSGRSTVSYYDWKEKVNNHGSYSALMELLEEDPVMDDQSVRELVLLLELSNMYNNKDFKPSLITGILQQLIQATPREQHRIIARNIIWDQTRLRKGQDAPTLELYDAQDNKIALEDYQGKYLVLFFMTSWCQACVSDLAPLADMAEDFQQEVAFAGILADRDEAGARSFITDNNLPVDLYYFDHDYQLLERYRIMDVPVYLVIDPQGKVVHNHFPAPAAGAWDELRKLLLAPGM
ncbi:MAG: TlpA disulfide reductase family protein [Bacteroidales bacterium]